nr:hypothetical protein CFP56_57066 [Quercus suber]
MTTDYTTTHTADHLGGDLPEQQSSVISRPILHVLHFAGDGRLEPLLARLNGCTFKQCHFSASASPQPLDVRFFMMGTAVTTSR